MQVIIMNYLLLQIRVCLLLIVFSVYFSSYIFAVSEGEKIYLDPSYSFEVRADDLVSRMTLEEKISQLGDRSSGIERLGILPYNWWNECLHGVARAGVATVFPQPIGMAASFDRELMYETACAISDEARAKHHEAIRNEDYRRYRGLTYWSPNINILRDPRWGRGHETYGEDPYLTGQLGIQFVRGLQGDNPRYLKLVATAKHFAVHSGPEPGRNAFNVVPNARDLWETYLPAFYDLVVTGKVYSVMGAYNRIDGEAASASWMLLEDILRNRWNFDGYVVSDCGAIHNIFAYHNIVDTAEEAAAIGIRRGCDLDCGSVYLEFLLESVKEGLIGEDEIDLAVYRLMLARMKLGMFDPPEMVPYAQIPYEVNDCQKHSDLALEMAQKSMVLLKNDGLLPFDCSKLKTIAVVGPNADSVAALRGNYYGTAPNPVTVLEGIRHAVGSNVEVLYSEGCSLVENSEKIISSTYLSTIDQNGQEVEGLMGQYFRGIELQGQPVLTRVDRKIQMDWGVNSPTETEVAQGILTNEQGLGGDNFSARWTGKLLAPVTGTYKIGLVADDGCRLFINGKKIAEGWYGHGMEEFSANMDFVQGKYYDIKIEYYEGILGAGIQLIWELPKTKDGVGGRILAKTIDDVQKSDVAIFVGGLDAEWEGEEMKDKTEVEGFDLGDRTNLELPMVQIETIKALQQTGTPVVFVLLAGGSIAFDEIMDDLPAILMGWYPGQRGGDAVADVLFGDYNPSGRLPVTFYSSTADLGDFKDYNMSSGNGRTYRYYQGSPLYPFGYGLSYTSFAYSDIVIDRDIISVNDTVTVSVKVKNTGSRTGDEVVQLYVRDIESTMPMPVKQLRGFEMVNLKPGEQKEVTFELKPSVDMRYYNARKKDYDVEPGDFEIQIGSSSSHIHQKGVITVQD